MANVYAPPSEASQRKTLVLSVLGLALFLAVEALLLRSFAAQDQRPPSWDQSIHLEIALDYREALKEGRLGDAWHLAPKPGMPPFPPLYHLLLTRAYDHPDPAHAALWANWLYLALLALAVFGVAWHFRPDGTALAVAVAFVASPAVQELYATQLVDLPITALAAASYWALLASNGFWWWTGSLLFGLLHAAGLLHKWSFFSYMIPAYCLWARALCDRRSAAPALAAAALSVAVTAPWYAAHLALLPSRLVSASADFAQPATTLAAWTAYLRQAATGLGPALWALGLLAALAPQYQRRREQGWVLGAWLLCGYVFWSIVPNRQLRFLMPALPPLAVALAAAWPKSVTWGVALFQLLGLFNYFGGWVGPVNLGPGWLGLSAFHNRPAQPQPWHIEEILRRIEAERDPARPVTNVTLVANDEHFNAPTFHWTQRHLGLPHARMRGVNRRLCELSEFVLLKDPKLGPASVVPGLPEAALEVKEPRGWFARAYEELARWPLPDKSSAILYRQRRGLKRPYKGRNLVYQRFSAGRAELRNLKARFGDWDPALSAYKTIALNAARVDVRGLAVLGLDVELEGVVFVPVFSPGREDAWADVRLLRLERLRLRALDIGADELKAFLESRLRGLEISELLIDKTVRLEGSYKGKAVSAEAALELGHAPRRLKVAMLSASWAGVGLPLWVFREIKELTVSLEPNPETPFVIELPSLTLKDGRLTVP